MESSALSKAQESSRSAFASSGDESEAQRNHRQAASRYANAASTTNDSEALRILRLLEEQHNRLATAVKSATGRPHVIDPPATAPTQSSALGETEKDRGDASMPVDGRRPSSPPITKKASREARASIASNLATARGIPSAQQRTSSRPESPSVPQTSARESLRRNIPQEGQPLGTPTPHEESNSPGRSEPEASPSSAPQGAAIPSDYAFQKFYSTVEGVFSALSAPLAYAGLPLSQTSHDSASTHPTKPSSPSPAEPKLAATASTPDITKLFSRAALNAVKEDHSIPIQDSFQVVPTGAGAIPHAKMLSHEERRARASTHDDGQDNFVDAREHPSKSGFRRTSHAQKSPKLGKTLEELEIENLSLKERLNEYSQKLYMWQQSSQRQTQELQASMRFERQRGPGDDSKRGGKSKISEERVAELEERVKKLEAELERSERENEKLKGVVTRYRQRWDELKQGAKMRRESPAGKEGG